jgi:hypothetical protein
VVVIRRCPFETPKAAKSLFSATTIPASGYRLGFRRQGPDPAFFVARPLEQGRQARNRGCSKSLNHNNQIALKRLLGGGGARWSRNSPTVAVSLTGRVISVDVYSYANIHLWINDGEANSPVQPFGIGRARASV